MSRLLRKQRTSLIPGKFTYNTENRRTINSGQMKKYKRDKQQSTNYTHKTKDRVTRTPVKTGSEHICSGRVGRFCPTSSTRGVNLVIDPVISHEWGKNQEWFPSVEEMCRSFVKLYIDEQHGSHPIFLIRKNIDLKEQEGKPNCKDIKINLQKSLCYSRTQRMSVYCGRGWIFYPSFSNVMYKYLKYYLNLELLIFQNPYH